METNNIIENLSWRYATKLFDPSKKVSDKDLQILVEVLRLSPSSYGLQPIKVLVIENKEIREKLKEKSGNQPQITDASHLFVICSFIDIHDLHVDEHILNISKIREQEVSQISGYGDFMKGKFNLLDSNIKKEWNARQAYIALGLLLHACAQLRIDSTPMEGFDAEGYDEILGLKAKNLHATVICPIGYRSSEDQTQFMKKVRKNTTDFIEVIK